MPVHNRFLTTDVGRMSFQNEGVSSVDSLLLKKQVFVDKRAETGRNCMKPLYFSYICILRLLVGKRLFSGGGGGEEWDFFISFFSLCALLDRLWCSLIKFKSACMHFKLVELNFVSFQYRCPYVTEGMSFRLY